jgi:hypothetical protein
MARGLRAAACGAALTCLGWAGAAQANAVTDWNEITVRYVAGGGGITAQRPGPVGFLDVALVQAGVHDAVQAIQGRYDRYHYDGAGAGNVDAAVAAAAHRLLVLLYPSQQISLDGVYNTYLTNHGLVGDAGLAAGELAAADLMGQYRPLIPTAPFFGSNAPGQWRSATTMSFQFLGDSTPFMINSVTQFRPGPPPPMQSMQWVRHYNETKAVGRTGSQTGGSAVDDFWNFDPLKMWNGTMRGLTSNSDVGDTARLFAMANLATSDSLMTVFAAKRFYNFWRPIMAIRNDDGNPRTAADSSWTPYITTPNYPEYPSGANGVSGAMTGVLRLFFGTDQMDFTIPGATVTRNYSSFSEAAQEVVDVRITEGIHFREADDDSRKLGERIALWGWQKYLKPTD